MEDKVRETLICSAGILAAVACLISFYLCFFGTGGSALVQYLITKLVSIPLSLYSTFKLVRYVDRGGISVTTEGKIAIVFVYAFSFLLSSLMLLSNIILHSMQIIRTLTGREERIAEANKNAEEWKKKIYMRSESRAVARILNDDDTGDIILDDGVNLTRYRQVALIKLEGERYALLSPYGKSHLSKSFVHAYLIGTYPDTGAPSLTPVSDGGLYDRVFAQYKALLEVEHS